MRYEPNINKDLLARAIVGAYEINISDFTFIPVGFAAACYQLFSGTERYFLKIWLANEGNGVERQRALRLARALHERNIYLWVAPPLRTRHAALSARTAEGEIALFPFIEGMPLPDIWPDSLQDQWVAALIRLHAATSQLADVLPERERFDLPFLAPLQQSLTRLRQLDVHARPGLFAARDRLLHAQPEIKAQIARLQALQQTVQRLPSPFAVCHTDLGADNLLQGQNGQLYLLDWDEARLAPPEHDLHEARWIDFERMVRAYHKGGGASPLHVEQFAFYLLRRALNDMTARVVRLFAPDADAASDTDALDGIEQWGFAQWRGLDGTLERIRPALHLNVATKERA